VTCSSTLPEPAMVVFCPMGRSVGESAFTLAWYDESPQSVHFRFKLPPSTMGPWNERDPPASNMGGASWQYLMSWVRSSQALLQQSLLEEHCLPLARHLDGARPRFGCTIGAMASCGSVCVAAEVSMSRHMRFSLLAPAALISIVPFASFAGMSRERDTSTATLTSPFATGHFRPSQVIVPTPSGNLMTLEEQTSPE